MTQPAPLTRIPESMGPKEIGAFMRGLREQFALTPQDISERLHIRVRYVTAIEEGNYDAMPGKVYARGYIHTYAEFLGLDADHLVAQCFATTTAAPEAAAGNKAAEFKPAARVVAPASNGRLVMGALGALLLVAIGYARLGGSESETAAVESPAPEALLSVTTPVMPVAGNYACLGSETPLGCFYAQRTLAVLAQIQRESVKPFAADIRFMEQKHSEGDDE